MIENTRFADLSGKRILVTGGTGFIGSRLVERLVLEHQAEVRVLLRTYSRAARIARFPIELSEGDITVPGDVQSASRGCDFVFHCAYGNAGNTKLQRRVNVDGTRNVMEAAKNSGIGRVVHMSTVSVYGATPDGDLDETATRHYCRPADAYSDTKLDGEKLALEYAANQSVPVAVIQPTMVYGPYAPGWTMRILNDLKNNRVILIDDGEGLCNPVYIDDVITAMLLAAVEPNAPGEVFLISGDRAVTWREFYERYEQMLGCRSTVNMSLDEGVDYYKRSSKRRPLISEALSIFRSKASVRDRILESKEAAALIYILQSVVPETRWQSFTNRVIQEVPSDSASNKVAADRPILRVQPQWLRRQTAKTNFRIDKARRVLGYEPAFDFETGMNLTEAWASWANLLNGNHRMHNLTTDENVANAS